ncbi:MAG TPA: thymidine phosphorylase [Candidatus Levybacteria bacterium]|nr:thymidine phosphorylase [Candidatus Levybacteria bacterium]
MDEKNLALTAIQKKLLGKKLSYREIYAIMDQIAHDKLGDILTTYFAASGYSKGFSNEEIYFLTRAMVETGETLEFKGITADKHSIGGTPGTRATMIIVPIIAAAGYTIPKSSSRAITTPAGTADCMEVLCKVSFTKKQIYKIVEKTNGCIVWGGSFNIAPADDVLIDVEEPLAFESFDKVLVSVMAKKIAFGSKNVIIDIPYGRTVKVHRDEDAIVLSRKFEFLAKKFDIKLDVFIHKSDEPAGYGIGPVLEARDALKVLEQTRDRPIALEIRALDLSERLLRLCLDKKAPPAPFKNTRDWAEHILFSGIAHEKMMEIIQAQGGDPFVSSEDLHPAKKYGFVRAEKKGKITLVDNKNISTVAKILGAPQDKDSGILLKKRLGESVEKGDELAVLYADTDYRVSEAKDSLSLFPLYDIA